MKLYDLPERQTPRPRIYGLEPNGDIEGWVEFDHIDGMYSFCLTYGGDGSYLGICHLKAWTPLEVCGDGYSIRDGSVD